MKIAARVSAETATAGGVEVRQFASELEVNGDRVVLSPLTFQLFGGRYQGAVNAQLGKALSLTIKSRLQDLNVAQLAAFGGAPDTISGTLTGAGTFSGSGPDVAAVLKSARGMGTATIANGAIRRLNLVRTVVLFFGRPAPDTAEGTDQFERIDANFSLANQILRAEPLSLRSRDADIVGFGHAERGFAGARRHGRPLALGRAVKAGRNRSHPVHPRRQPRGVARTNRRHDRGTPHHDRRRGRRTSVGCATRCSGGSKAFSRDSAAETLLVVIHNLSATLTVGNRHS